MSDHASLTAALAAVQGAMPAIVKTSPNPHFRSKYADLADGMGPLRPILAQHGIAYTQTFHVADGILLLRTSLRHGSEELSSELPITQPPKPQDFVALTTYYRRVALFSILGITPEGEDDDGNAANEVATTQSPPRQTRQPAPRLATPQAEVERALGATVTPMQRPDASADPWKLADVPAENVAAIMIAAIANRPWPEVTAALKVYRDKLTLTEHERALVRDAQAARKDQERQASLLAAG